MIPATVLAGIASLPTSFRADGDDWLLQLPPIVLSEEGTPDGPRPGGAADKPKIVRLEKTAGGLRDGQLLVFYVDADSEEFIWHPRSGVHHPADVFVRRSTDRGEHWTDPVNLSRTAGLYSTFVDWDGDGVRTPAFGDSEKVTVEAKGDIVVVSWVDRYAPESDWSFGDVGESSVQGSAFYPDLGVPHGSREMAFGVVDLAVSLDGGEHWIHGGERPPLQLTFGRRDPAQDSHRGSGKKWTVAWQEDPAGLQTGEGEGPGEGSSGAKTTNGTDVWYTFCDDITKHSVDLRENRRPLSNQSRYDLRGSNGFPMVGEPGSEEKHACSRAHLRLWSGAGGVSALVAYEETKGDRDALVRGKTVQYHAFPYDQILGYGPLEETWGDPGWRVTSPDENARRVKMAIQPPNGDDPVLALFWRQGIETEGGPADILLKVSSAIDPAAVLAAPLQNLSSRSEDENVDATGDSTSTNPDEDALAHRAAMRGRSLQLAYCYTPNQALSRTTDQENYQLYLRRSVDGGASWLPPQRISALDTTRNVVEPRLVSTPRTGKEDPDSFVLAWGTETNVLDDFEIPLPLDLQITRSFDGGETFEPIRELSGEGLPESALQMCMDDSADEVYAVWMLGTAPVETMFTRCDLRTPLHVILAAPPTLGVALPLGLHAPHREGAAYHAAASLGTTPGIDTPIGHVPLDFDLLLLLSLNRSRTFVGFHGWIGPDGTAPAWIAVPDDPRLQDLTFYVAFVTAPIDTLPWGISDAREITLR